MLASATHAHKVSHLMAANEGSTIYVLSLRKLRRRSNLLRFEVRYIPTTCVLLLRNEDIYSTLLRGTESPCWCPLAQHILVNIHRIYCTVFGTVLCLSPGSGNTDASHTHAPRELPLVSRSIASPKNVMERLLPPRFPGRGTRRAGKGIRDPSRRERSKA